MEKVLLITIAAVGYSYFKNRKKTIAGIRSGVNMFLNILPTILVLILLISVVLYVLPDGAILHYLGQNAGISAYVIAALIGSIALIPGFIAYPLAGLLLQNGVSYQVVAIFISTLLMVGVSTMPLEAKYFGWKVSLLRNLLYFFGAIITGITIGVII